MPSPLVATKLFAPKLRQGLVERSRLSERLRRGTQSKLTLISAPAGFGKTTLLAEWLAGKRKGRGLAWLSLDQTDNDLTVFWSHLIAALEQAAEAVGVDFPALMPAEQSSDSFLAKLLNGLSALTVDIDLVLDDYHVINQSEIAAGIGFLLEHLPSQIHLVISTRADPALPLGGLRARGELVEIRSADLRFTLEESSAYLNGAKGLSLTAKDVAVLGERTEGWIAALQMAVLSLEGRDDPTGFIVGFAGSDRYIVDYLVEEVLQRLPDDVRRFLFRTSFLGRLSGSLCDAVTDASGSKAMLDTLDRQNLFIVPLDDRRQWYRYHHLFADVLLAHLSGEVQAELPLLHRRASDWYEQQGERFDAIQHALLASDLERAAELIERATPEMQRNRGEAILRGWSRLLPKELVRNRPVLGIGFVGALVSYGEFDGIDERLRDVEYGLAALAEDSASSRVVVIDQSQLPRLPGAVELYRAALAQVRGDVPGIIEHAKRVLELAPADDDVGRAAGSSMLGIAYWSQGNLEPARRAWAEGRNGLQRAGHISDVLGVSLALSDINRAQGRLTEAIRVCQQALELAVTSDGRALRGTADMHAGLSDLYRERNDFDVARQHLAKSQELGEAAGLPQHPYRWRVAAALLRRDEGDLDSAVELLNEAEHLYVSDFFPLIRPVAAIRTRIWIAQGRMDDAFRWQRERGLGVDDELTYLREFEHITLARLLLVQDAGGEVAQRLLDRLLDQAAGSARMGSVIEISLLQSLAYRGDGDPTAPLVPLERALSLAEPESYVRLFVGGGERMATLLKAALKRGITPAYTRQLIAALGQAEPDASVHPDLIEPLSDRELDVLRLLRSDLGGPEIARELMISLNTMRTHTKNIYEKLGVNSRRSAIHRADQLSLLVRAQPQ
ncbi:MAG: LuxR C-terminal-related transcriptional regulator [Devosia sp.]